VTNTSADVLLSECTKPTKRPSDSDTIISLQQTGKQASD
jgi:hypothetical protein